MLLLGVTAVSLLTTPLVITLTHWLLRDAAPQYQQLPVAAASVEAAVALAGWAISW